VSYPNVKQQYGCKPIVFTAFAFSQMLLLGYLLTIDIVNAMLFGVVVGIPVAVICQGILQSQLSLNTRMAIAMTAVGGFGMLFACLFETGPLGLYSVWDMCQAISTTSSLFSLDWVWKRFMLTPWTYVGMVLGCNLGMWFLGRSELKRGWPSMLRVMQFFACNAGMFMGMFLFEHIAMLLISFSSIFNSPILMIIMMLLGMLFGILLFLSIVTRVSDFYGWVELDSRYQGQV